MSQIKKSRDFFLHIIFIQIILCTVQSVVNMLNIQSLLKGMSVNLVHKLFLKAWTYIGHQFSYFPLHLD